MSSDSGKKERQEIGYLGLGMSVGMVLGGLFGIVYGILLDNMAFMTIAVGGGLALGLSIGAGLEAHHKEKGQ
jgi:galactitol-specific phosphotransferase system IIC component